MPNCVSVGIYFIYGMFSPFNAETMKIISQMNQIGTLAALIVGSGWVLYKFFTFRWNKRRLNVSHRAQFIKKTGSKYIIRVDITLRNVGQVNISPIKGYIMLFNLDEIDRNKLTSKKWIENENITIADIDVVNFEYVPEHLEPEESETAHKLLSIDTCPNKMELYSCIEKPQNRFFKKGKRFCNHIKNLFRSKSKDLTQPYGWNKSTVINLQKPL